MGTVQWGLVAKQAAKTTAIGLGTTVVATAAVGAGVVSVPFALTVAGIALTAGAGYSYLNRWEEAHSNGIFNQHGLIGITALGDAIGISGLYEGTLGRSVITNCQLSEEERSRRLGIGIGGLATMGLGSRAGRLGSSLGGRVNPYMVPSISRPSYRNPILFGDYETPSGLRLNKNNFNHIRDHFDDVPFRINDRTGKPQAHGVFDEQYRGDIVRLLDDAFEGSTGNNPNAIGDQAGRDWEAVVGGKKYGTQKGHPQADGYGKALESYTVPINSATLTPKTMYPGQPARWNGFN